MSPPFPLPLGNATTTSRGYMTAAQVVALNALAGNTGDVTLGAVGNSPNAFGASLVGQALTLQPASSGNPGLVSTAAQSLKGQKTFVDGVIASSSIGTLVGDVCNKIGTGVSAGSLNGGAALLSIRAGLGGSEVEYAYFRKPVGGGIGGVLTLDAKTNANEFAIDLRGSGAGTNGIGLGTGDGSYIGVGNGFLELSMQNRLFRFGYNASGFSASPDAGFNFAGSALAIPFMRLAANAGHTGKLLSALIGSNEVFNVASDGSMMVGIANHGFRYDSGGDRIQVAGGGNGLQVLNAAYAAHAPLACSNLSAFGSGDITGLAKLGSGVSAGALGAQVPSGVHFGLNGNADTTFIASDATGAASIVGYVGNTLSMTLSPTSFLTPGDHETNVVGKGFILKSPDGTRYRIKVANGGALSTEAA